MPIFGFSTEQGIFAFRLYIKDTQLIDDSPFSIYTSPICMAIAFYFGEKRSGHALAKNKIALLAEKIQIMPTDKSTVRDALRNPEINDSKTDLDITWHSNPGASVLLRKMLRTFISPGLKF